MVKNSFKRKKTRIKSRRNLKKTRKRNNKSKVKNKINKMRGGAVASDPPDCFECPITLDIMKDPVITFPDGITYERSAIERVIRSGGPCPTTRHALRLDQLIPNRALKNCIDAYVLAGTRAGGGGQSANSPPTPSLNEIFRKWCQENGVIRADLGNSGRFGNGPHNFTLDNIQVGNTYRYTTGNYLEQTSNIITRTATITDIETQHSADNFDILVSAKFSHVSGGARVGVPAGLFLHFSYFKEGSYMVEEGGKPVGWSQGYHGPPPNTIITINPM
jgi:hypothetical protein